MRRMTSLQPSELAGDGLTGAELHDAWMILSPGDRVVGFKLLSRADAEDFFLELPAHDQAELLLALPVERAAHVDAHAPARRRGRPDPGSAGRGARPLLGLLDEPTRKEVRALLAYAEDEAGGLMNPRYARLRPNMTVDEAISYLRKQARERLETIYYVYVLDEQQHLLGVVSFRELFAAQPDKRVRDIMHDRRRDRPRGQGPGVGQPRVRRSTTCTRSRSSTPRTA